MMSTEKVTHFIKQRAAELGFSHCGISQARRLDEEAPRLEGWLRQQHHGRMAYMENHFEKRLDPRLLVEGARSVISLLFNYFPGNQVNYTSPLKVSSYAYGIDYHKVIKDRLFQLAAEIQANAGDINYRVFTDSAPVLDRAWAVNAGLGWIGKNTLMITRKQGSFFFIAEIITNLELNYDIPFGGNYCGDCTRCIDACPTQAIVGPRQLDASRCISYLTIELKDEIPAEFHGKTESWIFGCDICQQVCPWNRFSIAHGHAEFLPQENWTQWSVKQWTELEKPAFKAIFGKSAITRAGFKKLKNNINFAV
ncbi:MAG: tRNA epoxyqueuosine(34) reductase QueG [Lentimicrobiaceae bacterium]|jgi:epoxyqueuosine reductase|nr:tRNA epoxyqueuosine(34) reductase QueG [Lentimicrobiaceae bacterium]MDD4596721.1 tRNA epoxyqueuosine(34) reductase QueG [Lentimicrobiaceae bacterium]MDY0024954.1 tRNA epoxyqueuosine(34) reductase QueG [Lentimicrobium sp.]HAH60243.1 tRNA epoxyqueuosine(34) reductase QueG [Bacteroidales bacterium]